MILVTQKFGGTSPIRKFKVKDPEKINFWTMIASQEQRCMHIATEVKQL